MAISEESRHQMYRRLQELMGREEAATLMAHLPPVGWADVATKHDLDHLGEVLRRDIARLDVRIDAMEGRLDVRIDAMEGRLDARIDAVEARLDVRIGAVEARLDDLRADGARRFDDLRADLGARLDEVARNTVETRAGLRSLFLALVALQLSGAGLVLAVARLA